MIERRIMYNISLTGYEFCRRGIKQLENEDIDILKNNIGLICEKCGNTKSKNWYIEYLINNYLPDNRLICEKCK